MPHAQAFRCPVARGEGRLRHNAAVACRANWAYSSSKCAWQNASVSVTMASKVACMGLGTRSDLRILAMGLPPFLQGERLCAPLRLQMWSWIAVQAAVWCGSRRRVCAALVPEARANARDPRLPAFLDATPLV